MENSGCVFHGEEMDLPPGFRFHPTDEELISHYLFPKSLDVRFSALAIGEVDLNKCEPWDLPKMAKIGEKEWYFFSLRDRKYPTGIRTNRATDAGYWKATGKDKEIYKGKSLVGLKKTLVFYMGRAPKGEKSNWVMHEYRLENNSSLAKNEWVICRVFHKNSGGKKHPLEELPPLMDSTPYSDQTKPSEPVHVPCFSNPISPAQNPVLAAFETTGFTTDPTFPSQGYYPRTEVRNPHYQSQISPFQGNSQYPFGNYPDQNMLWSSILDSHGGGRAELNQGMLEAQRDMAVTVSLSQDTCYSSELNAEISSVVSNYDIDSFWSY